MGPLIDASTLLDAWTLTVGALHGIGSHDVRTRPAGNPDDRRPVIA
jgi:hypothetical protein